MPYPEQHFRWTWDLAAPPEALWPLVSNTDRFNRDCGYPPVTVVPPASGASGTPFPGATAGAPTKLVTNARRLRATVVGVVIEWDEFAFEWIAPTRFGVDRIYHSGPLARMLMFCELTPRPGGGTTLCYDMRLTPANLLGRLT